MLKHTCGRTLAAPFEAPLCSRQRWRSCLSLPHPRVCQQRLQIIKTSSPLSLRTCCSLSCSLQKTAAQYNCHTGLSGFHFLFYCLDINTFHIKKKYSTQYKTAGYTVMTGLCAQYTSGVLKQQIVCIILPLCILYRRTLACLCIRVVSWVINPCQLSVNREVCLCGSLICHL